MEKKVILVLCLVLVMGFVFAENGLGSISFGDDEDGLSDFGDAWISVERDTSEPSVDKPEPSVDKPKPSVDKPKPSVDKPKPTIDESDVEDVEDVEDERDKISRKGTFYTAEFYTALVIGLGVLILIGIVIWLFIRGPKNKWD